MLDLGSSFLASTERNPKATAIAGNNFKHTYLEWFSKIDKLAGALKHLGLKKKDKVITLLQNSFEAATIHWACQLNDLILVPLNWRMKTEEIDFCITNSEAKCIIYQDESLYETSKSKNAQSIIKIFVGNKNKIINIYDLMQNGKSENYPSAKNDSISVILYTSGTTGKPKGVPRTHSAERSSALAHVAQNIYIEGETTIGVMPLYHTMGIRSLIYMSLINGAFISKTKFLSSEAI